LPQAVHRPWRRSMSCRTLMMTGRESSTVDEIRASRSRSEEAGVTEDTCLRRYHLMYFLDLEK
jgi:hypothetical protein